MTAVFEKQLLARGEDLLVLFSAPWCKPGHRLEARLASMAEPKGFDLITVNVDRSPALAERYRVTAIPSITAFRKGQEVSRRLGELSSDDLEGWLTEIPR